MTADSQLLDDLRSGTWRRAVRALTDDGADVARVLVAAIASGDLPQDPAGARVRREAERAARFAASATPAPEPHPDDRPAVSVVVTAHEVEEWIDETLESLHLQTDPALEFIVVDDHSTDATSSIVERWAARDPRFRVVRPLLRGGANARNLGADLAAGTFLAFVDGDDIVAPDAYRHLLSGVASERTDLVYGNFVRFDPAGRETRSTTAIPSFSHDLRDVAFDEHGDLLANRACWNKLYRLETWRRHDVVFAEASRANDIAAGTAMCLAADRVSVVTRDVYRYRTRPGGTSMTARAGSLHSIVSYLDQERWCRDTVVLAGRPDIIAAHADVALHKSAWSEVRRYLGTTDERGVDPEVASALGRLLAAFDPEVHHLPVAVRLVFGAVVDAWPTAGALVGLTRRGKAAEITSRLTGWAEVLDGMPEPQHDWQPGADEIVDTFVAAQVARLHDVPPHPDVTAALQRIAAAASGFAARPSVADADARTGGVVSAALDGDLRRWARIVRRRRARTRVAKVVRRLRPSVEER